MAAGHDSSYKVLFSTPELVRDLILGFVPDAWLHGLDYTTLEIVPGNYITEDFSQRADDIVWRVMMVDSLGRRGVGGQIIAKPRPGRPAPATLPSVGK